MSNKLHETKSTASSSYVAQYHMTREPFADTIENDLFYTEPGRQQKLDILLHLTQYGNELVLLSGPTGSGKTSLLQQYILKALDIWVVARVDAQGGIDERKLLQQLFHQMNMDFHGATHSELFERMQHHFDSLQHSTRQAVLLIDNAEQLTVTALNRVLEMAALTSADNKPLLRIILFGNDALDKNFDDPLLGPQAHIVRRNVELQPFAQEQTTHYILHRLSAANFSADKPFTDAVLQKIHKQSGGWPGEINQLAHNVLIETLPTSTAALDNLSSFNKPRAAAAVAGIILVGALLFFQTEFNTWISPEPAQIAEQDTSLPAPVETLISNDETTDEAIKNAAALAQEMMTADDSDILATESTESTESTISNETIAATNATKAEDNPQATTVDTGADISKNVVEKETAPEAIKPPAEIIAAPPAKKHVSPIPADLPGFRHAWILKQNPEHYTLQMVAGNNIKTLRGFLREHPLDEPTAIYHTTRKGKPWFGLVQHSYPSKQVAINARSQLPAALRKQSPWVRKFSALQKDLGSL